MAQSTKGQTRAMWWIYGSTIVPSNEATWRTRSFQKALQLPSRIKEPVPDMFKPGKEFI